jgi:hypothetical protein
MAMGDRVALAAGALANASLFNTFDSSVYGFADKVLSVKMIRGLAFNAVIGNMIERFLVRRGFLDLYYSVNAKFADAARGLNEQDYNLDVLGTSNSMAHKIGADFTYVFDAETALRLKALYTFAGINTPKTLELHGKR